MLTASLKNVSGLSRLRLQCSDNEQCWFRVYAAIVAVPVNARRQSDKATQHAFHVCAVCGCASALAAVPSVHQFKSLNQ